MGTPVVFIKDTDVPWEKAETLEQYLGRIFDQNKTDSEEFKAMLAFFGRERCKEIYLKWKEEKKKAGKT